MSTSCRFVCRAVAALATLPLLAALPATFVLGGGRVAPGTPILQGIALDAAGNLFVADSARGFVLKIGANGAATPVAGVGRTGHSGDGGPATSAQIMATDVAFDNAGNMFIGGGSVVRKVTPSGVISTVAGIPDQSGASGDGGPAVKAQLGNVRAVAADSSGNVFIASQGIIRKVTPDGVISAFAGTGIAGFNAASGAARSVQIASLEDMAVDRSGNLYISDQPNSRVWKVTPAGAMSTLAGRGTSQLRTDTLGRSSTVPARQGGFGFGGDGGPAVMALLEGPNGVAVDSSGNVFIADSRNGRIRKVDPAGIITTVAGNGSREPVGDGKPAIEAAIGVPDKVAVDGAGNIFIRFSGRFYKFGPTGVISTLPVTLALIHPNRQPMEVELRAASLYGPWMPAAVLTMFALGLGWASRRLREK